VSLDIIEGYHLNDNIPRKVSESFDKTIAEWKFVIGEGKEASLKFLCDKLQLDEE
jgi:hypothetical protein